MTEHKPTADLISEIEARWGDRFEELKEPSPPGTTRRGYVVDIYNLLNALKTKIRLPKPSDRLAELEAALTEISKAEHNAIVYASHGGELTIKELADIAKQALQHKGEA